MQTRRRTQVVRVIVIAGAVIGFSGALILLAALPLTTSDTSAAASASRLSLYQTPVTHTIYTEQEALDRTLQELWPEDLEASDESVALMTYGDFSEWYTGEYPSGYPGKDEPVWVVAMTADGATLEDFIGDGDPTQEVYGFYWQWEACSGEPKIFGALNDSMWTDIKNLPNRVLTITPCDPPSPDMPLTGPPPWGP
jgi:hypothetical protein